MQDYLFAHNAQEIVMLYSGCFFDYHNCFDYILSGGSTDAACKVWCKLVKLPRRTFIFRDFLNGNLPQKWASLKMSNIHFIIGQKRFCLDNSATCW